MLRTLCVAALGLSLVGCRAVNPEATSDAGGPIGSSSGGNTDGGVTEDGGVPPSRLEPPIVHALAGVKVETLAGSDKYGGKDGIGAEAEFANPVGVVVEPSGSVLVTEYDGGRLRRVSPTGEVTTIATGLFEPFGVLEIGNTIYIQTDRDPQNRKGDDTGSLWRVPVAGGTPELLATKLGRPRGLASLDDGRLILSDRLFRTVSLFDPTTREITFLAGGQPGLVDGFGDKAQFREPYGVGLMPDGSLIIADRANHVLRRATLDGSVVVFAGDGLPGMKDDDDKLKARFDAPIDVVVDPTGNIYVSDANNHRIRRISSDGKVVTIAGDGTAGFVDGEGVAAKFYAQEQIDVSPDGRTLFVADGTGGDTTLPPFNRVRRISLE